VRPWPRTGLEAPAVRRLLGELSGRAFLLFKRDEAFAALAARLEAKIAGRVLAMRDAVRWLQAGLF
jgi:hypothetical protein